MSPRGCQIASAYAAWLRWSGALTAIPEWRAEAALRLLALLRSMGLEARA